MRLILFLTFVLPFQLFAQGEEEGPIMANPDLWSEESTATSKSAHTFDSTFIFVTDTLKLPFFDDFSRNKFQKYKATFTDPGVTSEKKFALMDNAGVSPFPANTVFSLDSTYRRYVDVANSTVSDTFFIGQNIKLGSLATFPVNYATTKVYPPYILIDTIDYPNPIDTIFLLDNIVYQDSSTQFFKKISDTTKLWLDERAYHNYRLAQKPWTLGVVSFDGLNEKGYPYSFGATGSNYADVLTSKPFDLSSNTPADLVYLSFLYQPQGFGDEPEAVDSLILDFYNPISNTWEHQWSVNGSSVQDFKVAHIPVVKPDYFNLGFQMRWRNYGSLAGGIDHFHMDYVILRKNSTSSDTLFKDFAFVYPVSSLLNEYSSVPWDHYKNNSTGRMTNAAEIVLRNGHDAAVNNATGGLVTIKHNGAIEGSFAINGSSLANGDLNYQPRTTYVSYHDFSAGYKYDETKPGTKQSFDVIATASVPVSDSTVNDTTFHIQYFGNYYAYDDGTAERAYGPTGQQARLAIKYTPYEADSVIGAMIHFVPSVQDVSNKLFLLTIWADNNGVPGSVLYEDNIFFPRQPIYETSPNKFVNYFFEDTAKVSVNGTFFIGWRQFDADRMNVGIDKNIDRSNKTFFSINGGSSWNASQIPGSIMIRPIFSTGMDGELGIKEKPAKELVQFTVYPNPTSGNIRIRRSDNAQVEEYNVFDAQGRQVLQGEGEEIEMSQLQKGVYLVRMKGSEKAFRVIKQ